jgi:hypothetical protein
MDIYKLLELILFSVVREYPWYPLLYTSHSYFQHIINYFDVRICSLLCKQHIFLFTNYRCNARGILLVLIIIIGKHKPSLYVVFFEREPGCS